MFKNLISIAAVLYISMSCAHANSLKKYKVDSIYDGEHLKETTLTDVVAQVKPGTIIVLGEYHAFDMDPSDPYYSPLYNEHQKKMVLFLEELHKQNPKAKINVGMEFINYTFNQDIADYMSGKISEADFLKKIKWGAHWPSYKPLVDFPNRTGGVTLGINLPRSISGAISKKGIDGLTPEEAAMLPPNFEVGRQEYRDRFYKNAGGGHIPPAAFEKYFAAQSSWDDTMAYQSVEYMKNRPDEFFIIVVGEFHVVHGGGTPDRLKARGAQDVFTIYQEASAGMNDKDLENVMRKDKNGDNRADYIWVSK